MNAVQAQHGFSRAASLIPCGVCIEVAILTPKQHHSRSFAAVLHKKSQKIELLNENKVEVESKSENTAGEKPSLRLPFLDNAPREKRRRLYRILVKSGPPTYVTSTLVACGCRGKLRKTPRKISRLRSRDTPSREVVIQTVNLEAIRAVSGV